MFLQFPEPALGRTRFTRKDSVTLTESFGIGMIRTPIESRMKYGFNPTNGRRRKYGFCGMDVQAALFRLCGN